MALGSLLLMVLLTLTYPAAALCPLIGLDLLAKPWDCPLTCPTPGHDTPIHTARSAALQAAMQEICTPSKNTQEFLRHCARRCTDPDRDQGPFVPGAAQTPTEIRAPLCQALYRP
ncbi:unnamed protein product [Caretta caretta]